MKYRGDIERIKSDTAFLVGVAYAREIAQAEFKAKMEEVIKIMHDAAGTDTGNFQFDSGYRNAVGSVVTEIRERM